MTSDKKPGEFWMPYNTVTGSFLSLALRRSKLGAEEALLKLVFNFEFPANYAKAEAFYAARDAELIKAENDGWRIRPVRLEFLDEDYTPRPMERSETEVANQGSGANPAGGVKTNNGRRFAQEDNDE